MKNLFFSVLMFSFQVAYSQADSAGVYKTSKDFSSQKLSYVCICGKQKNPIKLGALFNTQEIVITINGKKNKIKKSELFGYQDCNKKTYRFYHDTEYRLVATPRINLYFKEEEYGTGKNSSIEDAFFFSVTLDSEIIPLTIENLKAAYPDNERFHNLLDTSFRTDADLSTFNKNLKKYKIVQIFEESIK